MRDTPNALGGLDLIISTTGDWPSDCALNVAFREWSSFPPVLFGWSEAYGIAGHALLVNQNGGCLACGLTEHGTFEERVTDWQSSEKTLIRATGCGDFYQPYGVVDVAPTKAMISELALEYLSTRFNHSEWRTWVGDVARLVGLGGSVFGQWKEKLSAGDAGRKFFHQQWAQNPRCPLCN